eukprot:scaffold289577_cov36-Prasinocladus_malaysianus.AAC.2
MIDEALTNREGIRKERQGRQRPLEDALRVQRRRPQAPAVVVPSVPGAVAERGAKGVAGSGPLGVGAVRASLHERGVEPVVVRPDGT